MIKSENFFRHIGDVILIKEDIKEDEYITESEYVTVPKGTYQIMSAQDGFVDLYNIKTTEIITMDVDENSYSTIYMDPLERITFLVDAYTKQITLLTAEGWRIPNKDDKKDIMDITPFLDKLMTLQVLKETLEKKKD